MPNPVCMFCGLDIPPDELTREHFVPKCLWEKGQVPTAMRTVPAHKACNSRFSEDNEYFRDVLVMEDGADAHPAAAAVRSGALRRKFDSRLGSVARTLKNLSLRPLFTRAGLYIGMHPVFEVDRTRFHGVIANILKGVFYTSQKEAPPRGAQIAICDAREVDPDWLRNADREMVPWQTFGDSAFACRYVMSSTTTTRTFACLLQFYARRTFVGALNAPPILDASDSPTDSGNMQ